MRRGPIIAALQPLFASAVVLALISTTLAYSGESWRQRRGAITDPDREKLAKIVAYDGGLTPGIAIKDDKAFKKRLENNGLQYLDSIDKKNGLQVLLVRDVDTGRVFVLPRGTEPVREAKKDVLKADLGDILTGQLKIGKEQYESGKAKIARWISKYRGNVEVIGHSLGGAIAQRIVLDNARYIKSATLFNSPAIEMKTLSESLRSPSQMRALLNPDGTRKVKYYHARSDYVSKGGGFHVPGDVVLAKGGALENGGLAPHTEMIFGPGVKREPMDFYRYQSLRDLGDNRVDRIVVDLTRAWANLLERISPIKNLRRELSGRLTDLENAELRKIDRIKRERWRKNKRRKERLKDVVTAVLDRNLLDIEQGRKRPGKKAPKKPVSSARQKLPAKTVAKRPVRQIPAPRKKTAGRVGISGDFSGAFTGRQMIDGQVGARIRKGRFSFTVSGTKVSGRVGGELYFNTIANRFSGKVRGRYNPASGKITARLNGRWSGGSINGKIIGIQNGNGFVGKWAGGGVRGKWQTLSRRVVATGWSKYMCKKYPDAWIASGGTCK